MFKMTMRAFTLMILLGLGMLIARAQGVEIAKKSTYEGQYLHLVEMADGGFIAAGENSNPGNWQWKPRIHAFDSNGVFRWEIIPTAWPVEVGRITDLEATPDGNFLATGYSSGCDYEFIKQYLCKFTPNGTVLWEKKYRLFYGFGYGECEVIQHNSGDIYLSYRHLLLRANGTGDSLSLDSTALGSIHQIRESSNGGILLACDYGVELRGTNLQLINGVNFPFPVTELVPEANGGAVILAQTGLARLDSGLQTVADTILPQSGCFGLERYNGNYFLGYASGFLQVDSLFGVIQDQPYSNLSPMVCNDVIFSRGMAINAGYHSDYQAETHAVKSFSLSNGTGINPALDVAIVDFIAGPVNVSQSGFGSYDLSFQPEAKVVNLGNSVYEVSVSVDFGQFFICGKSAYTAWSGPVSLGPGDTVTIPFGNIFMYGLPPGFLNNFCFPVWTSAPNNQFDKVPGNDGSTFCLDSLLGLKDGIYFDLQIFPNPTRDRLFLEGLPTDGNPTQIFLYTARGERVRNETIAREGLILNLADLPAGLYLLEICREEGKIFRKILKE
ncbi:MAG: T9SS type A sorting domain-containing protein [Bacteroidia bacterium]|nr:T9SS type A sorting domain-containing protein [Bacteroidia bacterium]